MTDYLRKYKSLYASTASSFGTGTSETITLASVTDLPTDTEITLTFDRVDSLGAETPTKMERITGTISGSTLISYTRGVDGTTEQAHTSPVVEMIWNAADLNALVNGILVEHNQTGTHKTALVTTLKASGANVTTGTSDVTIVTPKAHADAGFVLDTDTALAADSDSKIATQKATKAYVDANAGAISSIVITITRDLTAASGDVSYTGAGFLPSCLQARGNINGTDEMCWGFVDSAKTEQCTMFDTDGLYYKIGGIVKFSTNAGVDYQSAIVKSYDADGFTLTWTKQGSPTGTGTADILCLK